MSPVKNMLYSDDKKKQEGISLNLKHEKNNLQSDGKAIYCQFPFSNFITIKFKKIVVFANVNLFFKVIKGPFGKRTRKIRTSVHFRRPKTFKPPRNPKYPRKSVPRRNRLVYIILFK